MTPWMLLVVLLAATNLAGFIVVRGRWGRVVGALAIASLIGTIVGDAVGAATGLELFQLGDFHVVAASLGAQLAMLATLLGTALLPARGDRNDA